MTVSLKERIDDQFYALATSQGGSDTFGFDSAKQAGWTVGKSVDDSGNHLIALTKTMPIDDIGSGSGMPQFGGGKGLAFDPRALQIRPGLLVDTAKLVATLPAPMPQATNSAANPYAAAGSALIPSVIGVHLELKAPGKVLETNGEATSDGATRWDVNLQKPTAIRYVVQTIDILHVAALLVIAAVIAAVAVVVIRKRAPKAEVTRITLA